MIQHALVDHRRSGSKCTSQLVSKGEMLNAEFIDGDYTWAWMPGTEALITSAPSFRGVINAHG